MNSKKSDISHRKLGLKKWSYRFKQGVSGGLVIQRWALDHRPFEQDF